MIEKMEDFFATRADTYDEHMIETVIGPCGCAYKKEFPGFLYPHSRFIQLERPTVGQFPPLETY